MTEMATWVGFVGSPEGPQGVLRCKQVSPMVMITIAAIFRGKAVFSI